MIAQYLTVSNITFGFGILAIIFSIYRYFRDPQIDEDKKAALLSQQVTLKNESIDRRFKDLQDSFQQLLLQSNNHIHTVDTKVDALTSSVGEIGTKVAVLATIIDERIPKK